MGAGSVGGASDGRCGIFGRLYVGGGGKGTTVDPDRGLNFSRSAETDFPLSLIVLSAKRLGVFLLMYGLLSFPSMEGLSVENISGLPFGLEFSSILPETDTSVLSGICLFFSDTVSTASLGGAATGGGDETFNGAF